MNRRNYQQELEQIIKENLTEQKQAPDSSASRAKHVLLHSCCAPCSSYCIEYLSQFFYVTVFYYNPNIYPDEEYYHRVKEQQEFIRRYNDGHPEVYPVDFIEGDFETEKFYDTVKGLENEPERGRRCVKCFHLRLSRTAEMAREIGADYFTTTLTISPMKDAVLLNAIGEDEAARHGVMWLPSDFKKKNGYLRSCELSKEYGIFRQYYCGCEYSKAERDREIAERNI